MIRNPQWAAIIPARRGSKTLPNKNKKLMNGKPLISYTVEAALNSAFIRRTIVTTDDPEIAEIAVRAGAEVPYRRPAHLAGDTAAMKDVVAHLLNHLAEQNTLPVHFVLLQPTCPLRTHLHIDEAIRRFQADRAMSLVSLCEVEEHPYIMKVIRNGRVDNFMSVREKYNRRQDYPKVYRLNGAIYICRSRAFLKQRRFQLDPCVPYIMDRRDSIDIDTLDDFDTAERRILERRRLP